MVDWAFAYPSRVRVRIWIGHKTQERLTYRSKHFDTLGKEHIAQAYRSCWKRSAFQRRPYEASPSIDFFDCRSLSL